VLLVVSVLTLFSGSGRDLLLVMVDPLKVFWVLTNSTYLGKDLADVLVSKV
jgi:hypothetical protein